MEIPKGDNNVHTKHTRKKILILPVFLLLLLCSCNKISERDFSGEWIINKAVYKNEDIVMASKSIKLAFLPSGYENKQTIRFNVADSTLDMPGMYTKDVPCRWMVKDKKLTITFDSSRFTDDALRPLDSIKTAFVLSKDTLLKKLYTFKRDSILRTLNTDVFKKALPVYLGTYNVKKIKGGLILTSPTTRFELVNSDYALRRVIDKMFGNL